jgi:hypothetical protein
MMYLFGGVMRHPRPNHDDSREAPVLSTALIFRNDALQKCCLHDFFIKKKKTKLMVCSSFGEEED